MKKTILTLLIMTTLTDSEEQTSNLVKLPMDKGCYEKPLEQHTRFKERFRIGRIDSALIDAKTNEPFSGVLEVYCGKLKAERRPYTNGFLQGKSIQYHDNGNIMREENYMEGKMEGESRGYRQNGKLSSTTIFENGIVRNLIAYHENGVLSAEYNQKTGIRKRYYDTNIVYAIDRFEKGRRPDNGDLPDYSTYHYENGHKWKEGKEVYLTLHVHDEQGHQKRFDIIPTGHWIIYHESTGEKNEEGEFGLGGRHEDIAVRRGQWKVYDEKGKVLRYDYYEGFFGKVTRSEPAPEK